MRVVFILLVLITCSRTKIVTASAAATTATSELSGKRGNKAASAYRNPRRNKVKPQHKPFSDNGSNSNRGNEHNSIKSKQQLARQGRSVLVVNSTTCQEVSYRIVKQWDPKTDIPFTVTGSSQAHKLTPQTTIPLSDMTPVCTAHAPSDIIRDTIDLVCDIRINIKPKITMVTLPRCLVTAWLTLAALRFPSRAGDIVETGTWRGGMSALSLLLMRRYGNCSASSPSGSQRRFWAFDSFEGLPEPVHVDRYRGKQGQWSVSQDDFLATLSSFRLHPADNVVVTKGFFNVTLPLTTVTHIAFLRLDGDLYESTRDALVHLYDKVVPGGFIYVDDYHSFMGCKVAVSEFLASRGLRPVLHPVHEIDSQANSRRGAVVLREAGGEAVWWKKEKK